MSTIQSIILENVNHRGEARLLLRFPFNKSLIEITKQLPHATWSMTLKGWHIPSSVENYQKVITLFKDKAWLNWQTINTKVESTVVPIKPPSPSLVLGELSYETLTKIDQLKLWMQSRRYSENTIKTYTDSLRTFLRFYNHKPLAEINNSDVVIFNNEYIIKNMYSASFQNQLVNALKLFFKVVENSLINIDLIHRPKRAKLLPNVLSKAEVKEILSVATNIKHKAMLSLVYSCGLRCGELLHLKLDDIDSKRNLIIIRKAKGQKDRIVPLSEKILVLLREYYVMYKPKNNLFEGQFANTMYDERSLQQVLKTNLAKTKITKPVTLHWLRHSYATHLLEAGTDLRYIQEILGHSSSRTTEIYTHVSTKNIQKIISPFDTL